MKKGFREGIRSLWKDERGSQLIEFILVFPLVWLLIVFAFDQFSIMYNKQKALAAAYEAGRIAAVQPNYGLAAYYAEERGKAELRQAIGSTDSKIRLLLREGSWSKGNHVQTEATLTFKLLATGTRYQVTESYFMMIENAEERK